MKRFLVEFEGEEDYVPEDRSRPVVLDFEDDIFCMIPVANRYTALVHAKMLVESGVNPDHIMVVRYRFAPNVRVKYGASARFATAILWDYLSGYDYDNITSGWWFQIMYYPTADHDKDWAEVFAADIGVGDYRQINPSTDFEYFEVVENPVDRASFENIAI